tara:strand:- start:81 stop:674 length:594 start_codon:yes stop_codon:yes gene_type:complete
MSKKYARFQLNAMTIKDINAIGGAKKKGKEKKAEFITRFIKEQGGVPSRPARPAMTSSKITRKQLTKAEKVAFKKNFNPKEKRKQQKEVRSGERKERKRVRAVKRAKRPTQKYRVFLIRDSYEDDDAWNPPEYLWELYVKDRSKLGDIPHKYDGQGGDSVANYDMFIVNTTLKNAEKLAQLEGIEVKTTGQFSERID